MRLNLPYISRMKLYNFTLHYSFKLPVTSCDKTADTEILVAVDCLNY